MTPLLKSRSLLRAAVILKIVLVVILCSGAPVMAQDGQGRSDPPTGDEDDNYRPPPGTDGLGVILSPLPDNLRNVPTNVIVKALNEVQDFCRRIEPKEYQIDCLAERLEATARSLPTTGEYADVRSAILEASERLAAVARRNRSPSLPAATARAANNPTRTTSRPLVPVASERLAAANRQATAIIEEAETTLLRSAESPENRMSHYQRIAAAVGSNKVLLRS
ncbi:hypothetical protein [Aliiroseovarius sp. YM-037]|uniref:hypothetical protein n=1 Tax=Aliiroseovarius sp. YM-037 TaxID=3341728 RepID=UPI003A8059AA